MANANLLARFAQPVRSVQDFQDDYMRQDIAKQGMQRNALLLQEGQAVQQDRERTRMDGETLRNALAALPPGATHEQRIGAMEATNLPSGYSQADALRKAITQQAKDAEETAGKAQKRGIEGDQQARLLLQSAQNPTMAADMVRYAVDKGYWTKERAMSVLDGMPIDLTQWDTWRNRQLAPAMAPKDILPATSTRNTGGTTDTLSTDLFSGVPRVTSSAPITQDANSKATERTAAAGRAQSALQFGARLAFDKEKETAARTGTGSGTVDERNAAGYASRMTEATKLLDQFEKEGRSTYRTDIAGGLPMIGNAARTAVMTPVQQQYRQAQEDWVRAKLRKESGAAIATDEMDREIASYFPQPGEAAPVIEQKRRARAVAVEAMSRASGRAGYTSTVPPSGAIAPGSVLKFDAQGNMVSQ